MRKTQSWYHNLILNSPKHLKQQAIDYCSSLKQRERVRKVEKIQEYNNKIKLGRNLKSAQKGKDNNIFPF